MSPGQSKSTCHACRKDYAENLYSLLYCLTCDLCVCENCVARNKVKAKVDGSWQCPNCGKWLTVKESRLFAPE